MFSIGDLVVHPMHGAGVIADIVQEKTAGVTREYYVFKAHGRADLKHPALQFSNDRRPGHSLPRRSAGAAGGHPRAEGGVQRQLEQALSGKSAAPEKRGPLRGGQSGQVPDAAGSAEGALHRRAQKCSHNARQIIVSEIVLVENCAYQEAESRLDRAMLQEAAV